MTRAHEVVAKAVAAAAAFRRLDQAATDRIVRAAFLVALENRVALAKLAAEETGLGLWQHKVIKNVIATQLVYEDIRGQRTVGVVAEDSHTGIIELAQPLGPILGFVPITNPTATAIFKILITLKTRNPLILSPPQAATRCVSAAADLCYRAALEAGAPENCIQWLSKASQETLSEVMSNPRLALILATGADAIVRRAYRSGTPVIGVGPGNVPVYIGASADVPFAVRSIIESKTFDNGTVCASEQAVVMRRDVAARVRAEFERLHCHFLSPDEVRRVGAIAYDSERMTMAPTVVGQPVSRIAQAAGIEVPSGTALLIAPLDEVGPEAPLSAEILAPILAFYVEDDFESAIRRCSEITQFGGVGHTAVIYSNNDERIEYFSRTIDAGRILVNMPSTHGALGGMFNTLSPSFTLGCGSGGNNLTTDNVTVRHLLNIHRITRRRPNPRWTSFNTNRYLNETTPAELLEAAFNRNF